MRKLFIIFGIFLGILIAAIIIIPLVVDVDKYRPQIVSLVNERLNGKLELGHLSLSLWGRVKIEVDGLKLTDANGNSIVEVQDVNFNMPFIGLLSGRPELRIQLFSPSVNIVKQKNAKFNLTTIMKPSVATAQVAPSAGAPVVGTPAVGTPAVGSAAPGSAASGTAAPNVVVPAIVMSARYTFLLEHAKVDYRDEQSGDKYFINDLNFRLKDVSPSGNMPFDITAQLDLLAQKKIKVTGPLSISGNIQAHSTEGVSTAGVFNKVDAKVEIDLNDVEIQYPGMFYKPAGIALGAQVELTSTKDEFRIPHLKFTLADVSIEGEATGKIPVVTPDAAVIDFKAHSNKISLAEISELSPLAKQAKLNGYLELSVRASGPTDRLDYGADIKLNQMRIAHDLLSQELEVNGVLAVVTDQIKNLNLTLNAKSFDVQINGLLQNFLQPRFRFNVNSNIMDLDGLLKASAKAAEVRKAQASQASSGAASSVVATHQQPVVDYNAMLSPLRENPILAGAGGTVNFQLKKIKSTGVTIENFQGQFALNNLLIALSNLSLSIFDGSIKGGMSVNAKLVKPEVGTKIAVHGLQTQKMVESQMPFARNTVKGAISADLNIGGLGLNQAEIISNWHGNGSFNIRNAAFSTIDVGKQIRDGVIEKLPAVAKGKVKVPDTLLDRRSEYEVVSAKFAMANGVLNITEMNGKAYPNKGLDLRGNGAVKLTDYGLDLNLDIIDTYNLMHGDEIARDSRYGHFTLSPHVMGTLFSPRFDWGTTLARLGENALKTSGKQAAAKAISKALGDKVPGASGLINKVLGGPAGGSSSASNEKPAALPSAGPKVDDVKNALKGLFGH